MTNIDAEIERTLLGRPVLVTGAAGFVGSHLTEKLVELGARVHVFIRATSSGSPHNLAAVRDSITVHRGDLADRQAIMVALRQLQADGGRPIIFHLGGQAHVGESWTRPYETIYTNVLGTLNLLQSVVDLQLQCYRIDVAGSSEEYGNVRQDMLAAYQFDAQGGGVILSEASPLNPKSIYGTSKVAEDFIARNYHAAYGLPCVVTRMFNNYGPRQSPRFITGTIITQALARGHVELGYLAAKRDFCYVADGVMGHIHTALFGKPGDVYVYGWGMNKSILEWYNMIIVAGQAGGYWKDVTLEADTQVRERLGKSEVEELRVDYGKLHALTGWKPQHDWTTGLTETIKWYSENRTLWGGRTDW